MLPVMLYESLTEQYRERSRYIPLLININGAARNVKDKKQ